MTESAQRVEHLRTRATLRHRAIGARRAVPDLGTRAGVHEFPRTKVLFVAGAARSGTTLVDLLLGRMPGFTAVGELRYLWQRGLLEGRLCGCGTPVGACPFWRAVLTDAGLADPASVGPMVDALEHLERPKSIVGQFRTHAPPDETATALATRLAAVYRSVAARSGAEVVVDSSKPPTYGWLLRATPSIDLHVVHIVRDPRACAFSLQRSKRATDRPDGGLMRRQPSWKAAMTWDLWNVAADRFRRAEPEKYLQVRYEDLVTDPDAWVRRMVRMVGAEERDMPPMSAGTRMDLDVNHTVAGNPIRLDPSLAVSADREWADQMPSGQRRVVEAISRPVMQRYGYRPAPRH